MKAITFFKSSGRIESSVHLLWLLSDRSLRKLEYTPDRNGLAYTYEVASQFGLEDLVHVLLDRRTEPYPNLDSSLVYASYGGHLNIARLLLQNGAAIDGTIQIGSGEISALESACEGGCLAMVEFLIENGADIHGRNTSYIPPIYAAVASDSPEIIDMLVKNGVDVNARHSREGTACHVAAEGDKIESTRRLIDAGCDLELRNDNGQTVLLTCDLYPNPETINLLLDGGADACAKTKTGETLRNIIEERLGQSGLWLKEERRILKPIVERLRQAEQQASTTATNNPQQSEPTSSEQTVSSASTSQESVAS